MAFFSFLSKICRATDKLGIIILLTPTCFLENFNSNRANILNIWDIGRRSLQYWSDRTQVSPFSLKINPY